MWPRVPQPGDCDPVGLTLDPHSCPHHRGCLSSTAVWVALPDCAHLPPPSRFPLLRAPSLRELFQLLVCCQEVGVGSAVLCRSLRMGFSQSRLPEQRLQPGCKSPSEVLALHPLPVHCLVHRLSQPSLCASHVVWGGRVGHCGMLPEWLWPCALAGVTVLWKPDSQVTRGGVRTCGGDASDGKGALNFSQLQVPPGGGAGEGALTGDCRWWWGS